MIEGVLDGLVGGNGQGGEGCRPPLGDAPAQEVDVARHAPHRGRRRDLRFEQSPRVHQIGGRGRLQKRGVLYRAAQRGPPPERSLTDMPPDLSFGLGRGQYCAKGFPAAPDEIFQHALRRQAISRGRRTLLENAPQSIPRHLFVHSHAALQGTPNYGPRSRKGKE